MGLELYSKVEPYLGFEEEVYTLHKEYMTFIMSLELDNIIDIGCGQGYLLQTLMLNDKKAFGIDLSAQQIKVCEEKGLNAKAIDLKHVDEKFDCATAVFDVLNYIHQDSLEEFLTNTANVLNKGGYFIFDVNSLFGFEEIAQGTLSIDLEEVFINIDANFENKELKTDITLFSKNESGYYIKEQDSIIQYFHAQKVLNRLLSKTGFEIVEKVGFNLHSFDESDKFIYLCKKQ